MSSRIIKKWLWPVAVLLAAVAILGYFIISKPKPDAGPRAEKTYAVDVQRVQPDSYTPTLELYGKVESPQTAKLEAAINAYVAQTPVKEGEKVTKGELLIQLDDRDAKLLVAERKAEVDDFDAQIAAEIVRYKMDVSSLEHEQKLLDLGEKQLQRQLHLKKTAVASARQYDAAEEEVKRRYLELEKRQMSVTDHDNRLKQLQARRDKAAALLDKAELDLERTKVLAPFTGRVTKVNVAVGERVRIGDLLVKVFDTNATEVRAQIPSQYIARIAAVIRERDMLNATGYVDDQVIPLKLERFSGEMEIGRVGIDGLFVVDDDSSQLTLGRTVTIMLNLPEQKDVYALPLQALYGGNSVYRVVDERLQAVPVERVGILAKNKNDRKVLVKSDQLQAGDLVIINQLPNAITGLKVSVQE